MREESLCSSVQSLRHWRLRRMMDTHDHVSGFGMIRRRLHKFPETMSTTRFSGVSFAFVIPTNRTHTPFRQRSSASIAKSLTSRKRTWVAYPSLQSLPTSPSFGRRASLGPKEAFTKEAYSALRSPLDMTIRASSHILVSFSEV